MNRFFEIERELRVFRKSNKPVGVSKSFSRPRGRLKTFNLVFDIKDWNGAFAPEGSVEYEIFKDGKTEWGTFVFNSPSQFNEDGTRWDDYGDVISTKVKLHDNADLGRIVFRYHPGRQSVPNPYFKGSGKFRLAQGTSTIGFDVNIKAKPVTVTASSQHEAYSEVVNKEMTEKTAEANAGLNIGIVSMGGGGSYTSGSENSQMRGQKSARGIQRTYTVMVPLPALAINQA